MIWSVVHNQLNPYFGPHCLKIMSLTTARTGLQRHSHPIDEQIAAGRLSGNPSRPSSHPQYVQQIVKNKRPFTASIPALAYLPIPRSPMQIPKLFSIRSAKPQRGVGDPIPQEIAKLMLLAKVHSLARDFPACSCNRGAHSLHIENDVFPLAENAPWAPPGTCAGRICASHGRLGEVIHKGTRMPPGTITTLDFHPFNSDQKKDWHWSMAPNHSAYAIKAFSEHNCLEAADIIGAWALSATGTKPRLRAVHALRPYPGKQLVSQRLRYLWKIQTHAKPRGLRSRSRPYSLRCMPQVHGASRNACCTWKSSLKLSWLSHDNPIFFWGRYHQWRQFSCQPMALPLDYTCFSAAEAGNISDRRCYLLLEGKWGCPFCDENVVSQQRVHERNTPLRRVVTENKTLCFPQVRIVFQHRWTGDHGHGSISGRKLNKVLDNLEYILAINYERCQAIESGGRLKARHSWIAHDYVRNFVSFAEEDRIFANDVNRIPISSAISHCAKNQWFALQKESI